MGSQALGNFCKKSDRRRSQATAQKKAPAYLDSALLLSALVLVDLVPVLLLALELVLLGDSHFLNAHHLAVFDDGTDCGREFGKVVLGKGEAHTLLGQLLWWHDFSYILATQNCLFNALLDAFGWFAKVLEKQ